MLIEYDVLVKDHQEAQVSFRVFLVNFRFAIKVKCSR